jgi:hypothetical protein
MIHFYFLPFYLSASQHSMLRADGNPKNYLSQATVVQNTFKFKVADWKKLRFSTLPIYIGGVENLNSMQKLVGRIN